MLFYDSLSVSFLFLKKTGVALASSFFFFNCTPHTNKLCSKFAINLLSLKFYEENSQKTSIIQSGYI